MCAVCCATRKIGSMNEWLHFLQIEGLLYCWTAQLCQLMWMERLVGHQNNPWREREKESALTNKLLGEN